MILIKFKLYCLRMLSHKFYFSFKNLRRKTCLYFFLWKKLNTLFTWLNYTWTIPRAFDHDLNKFKLYCLRMLSDRLLAHTVRVLDKSLFPMGRCGFRFQYSWCRRIQNFTSGQDLVLLDWLFWSTTHSLHRSLLVHASMRCTTNWHKYACHSDCG